MRLSHTRYVYTKSIDEGKLWDCRHKVYEIHEKVELCLVCMLHCARHETN